jgi:hypothetical protein
MPAWTNFWRIVQPISRKTAYSQPTVNLDDGMNLNSGGYASFSTVAWYSNLLKGATARLQRYKQYDAMDTGDVSRALDIIAEEISNPDKRTGLPFIIDYQTEENQEVPDTTVSTVRAALRHWAKFHSLNKRVYNVSRVMVKYGDCFFRKTSDTKKWEYIDPTRVIGIEINEDGEKVAYHIRPSSFMNTVNMKKTMAADSVEISPAGAILHFTLSNDMGETAPFGLSVLQSAFKDYQKLTMLEDAAVIYRIVRAPERRVFYLDVGNMPPQRVKQYLESVRNDIRQKRSPNTGNANQTDSQYNAECFDLSTRIPLLDGRTLTLSEIITEHQAGKKNWAYSCDPVTGKFAPGPITWAGVTRKNAKVVKLTLDNGKEIICTPDHKFPIRGKGKVEAKDILVGEDSLFPFNTRNAPINRHGGEYQQIWNNATQEWIWTHRTVSKFKDQHNIPNIMRHLFEGPDEKCTTIHHCNFNRFDNSPDNLVRMENKDHWRYHSDNINSGIIWEGFKRWKEEGGESYQSWQAKNVERCKAWSEDSVFMTAQTSSWKEFKQKSANFNHKVVKIELLEERQDTGCLTVDGNELYHDHHTVALDAGVFAGQSIQDDFFFPTTGTGRGSRVETLPGGATWDMPELDFFLNKVFRALRVPSSYMKGTQEAPGAVYNDGKVGIAYMEERIFANFIIRQQSCIEEIFDAEFKTYLQVTGINIDPDLFRLKLEEPQNFALYRQAALDAELISSFKSIEETPYLSKRFMMERFLGLTKDDMQMNEVMLKQERNIEDQLPVNSLQQMYDPNVEAPKLKVEAPESGSAEEAPPEEGGGAEEAPPEEAA